MANKTTSPLAAPPGGFGGFSAPKTAGANKIAGQPPTEAPSILPGVQLANPANQQSLKKSYSFYRPLVDELRTRGYSFARINNIIENAAAESNGELQDEKNPKFTPGRGYVQVTGAANNAELTKRLNERMKAGTGYKPGYPIDLVKNPGLANDPKYAAQIAGEFLDYQAQLAGNRSFGNFPDKSIYDTQESTMLKALRPAEKKWSNRRKWLDENGWGIPTFTDYVDLNSKDPTDLRYMKEYAEEMKKK